MKKPIFTFQQLSARELEIIELIVFEHSTKEIADILCLSSETIKSHRSSIMYKLCVRNVAGIVREAIFQGLITAQNNIAVA